MSNHTPGPWIAEDGVILSEHPAEPGIESGRKLIAMGVAWHNAPIIKAAPDMLATLESLVDEAENKPGFAGGAFHDPVKHKIGLDGVEYASPAGVIISGKTIMNIKALIAQAKGESDE